MALQRQKYSARQIILSGIVLLTIAASGGGFYAYWLWSAPYRTVAQFVHAAEIGDAETLYRLSVPEERAATKLTPQAAGYALRDAFQDFPARKVLKVEPKPGWQTEHRSRQREYQCVVWWGDKATGKPLPGRWDPSGQMTSLVILKQTGEGWRIFTTMFLNTNYLLRWGRPEYFDRYEQMLKQTGMTGRLEENNQLTTVSQLRQYKKAYSMKGTFIPPQ